MLDKKKKKKKYVNDVLRKLSNRFRVIEKSTIYSINGLDCIIPRIIETGAGQLNAISLMVAAAWAITRYKTNRDGWKS